MTSWNGNIFRVTGPLWGESTGHRWIPLKKACDAELWCFLWSAPEHTAEQTLESPVIWDAIAIVIDITVMNRNVVDDILASIWSQLILHMLPVGYSNGSKII